MKNVKQANKQIESYDDSITFSLPGQGQAYENCGQFIYKGHFDIDAGEVHYDKFPCSCNRFECPVCNAGWRSHEVKAIRNRLKTYQRLAGKGGHIIHYVVSPKPQSISKLTDYKSLRSKMYEVSRRAGIIGGVAIFHYFRHPSSLNDRTEICPDNPHWHVLGDGYFWNGFRPEHLNISVLKTLAKEGWIVKYVHKLKSQAQMSRTIDYALTWGSKVTCPYADLSDSKIDSYVPELPKVEIETWFGIMSYSAFKVVKFKSEGIRCQICNQIIPVRDWHEIVFLKGDPPDDHGVLHPGEGGGAGHDWEMRLTWRDEDYLQG